MHNDAYNEPSRERDRVDLVNLASTYLGLVRCPGGRLTVKGYICEHCGHDWTASHEEGEIDPAKWCGQPVADDGYTPVPAQRVRAQMEASEKRATGAE